MFNLLALTITMAIMLIITLVLYIVDHYKYKKLLDKHQEAQGDIVLCNILLNRAVHASYRCYKCGRMIAAEKVCWFDDVPYCEKHASKKYFHKQEGV